jgi:hypothetical protein
MFVYNMLIPEGNTPRQLDTASLGLKENAGIPARTC